MLYLCRALLKLNFKVKNTLKNGSYLPENMPCLVYEDQIVSAIKHVMRLHTVHVSNRVWACKEAGNSSYIMEHTDKYSGSVNVCEQLAPLQASKH